MFAHLRDELSSRGRRREARHPQEVNQHPSHRSSRYRHLVSYHGCDVYSTSPLTSVLLEISPSPLVTFVYELIYMEWNEGEGFLLNFQTRSVSR